MSYFEMTDLYGPEASNYTPDPSRPEPKNDWERIDRIMEMLQQNPSPSFSVDNSFSREAAARTRLPTFDPNNGVAGNLGDEMVMLAAGLAAAPLRVVPFIVRGARNGAQVVSGVTAKADQALSAFARSFMNRLGRPPSVREIFEAFAPTKIAPPQEKPDDPPPEIFSPQVRPETERWPVTPFEQALGEKYDALRALRGNTFQSYTKEEIDRATYYAGITSGPKAPYQNVAQRDARKYPSPNYLPAVLDKSSPHYSSIRGREQNLIDYYRGRGISDNKRNSIWLRNKLRNYYLRNANEEFGQIDDNEGEQE